MMHVFTNRENQELLVICCTYKQMISTKGNIEDYRWKYRTACGSAAAGVGGMLTNSNRSSVRLSAAMDRLP
jgi:hypothetical protein